MDKCSLVDGCQALCHCSAAVEAQIGQAQLVQQPLQDVQRGCPLGEDEGPASKKDTTCLAGQNDILRALSLLKVDSERLRPAVLTHRSVRRATRLPGRQALAELSCKSLWHCMLWLNIQAAWQESQLCKPSQERRPSVHPMDSGLSKPLKAETALPGASLPCMQPPSATARMRRQTCRSCQACMTEHEDLTGCPCSSAPAACPAGGSTWRCRRRRPGTGGTWQSGGGARGRRRAAQSRSRT